MTACYDCCRASIDGSNMTLTTFADVTAQACAYITNEVRNPEKKADVKNHRVVYIVYEHQLINVHTPSCHTRQSRIVPVTR